MTDQPNSKDAPAKLSPKERMARLKALTTSRAGPPEEVDEETEKGKALRK
ncbi:hypothetical protein [Flavimaricola marinus]|uniref:Uncharacterized protein n=1 Tax=Flavimaricola marinus TaxID=1819565 RepID=A0A238LAR4_9RHOB|nr:hypothetical protein [Flavimaricola marinus]SMY06515.1 hypothetical protein LOM8899_00641 [Flavimaricola marinus]